MLMQRMMKQKFHENLCAESYSESRRSRPWIACCALEFSEMTIRMGFCASEKALGIAEPSRAPAEEKDYKYTQYKGRRAERQLQRMARRQARRQARRLRRQARRLRRAQNSGSSQGFDVVRAGAPMVRESQASNVTSGASNGLALQSIRDECTGTDCVPVYNFVEDDQIESRHLELCAIPDANTYPCFAFCCDTWYYDSWFCDAYGLEW